MAKQNKATKSWEALMNNLEETHAKRFDAILHTMDDEEFAKNYIKILEYAKPKLQRSEIIDENPNDSIIRIEYVESQSDKESDAVTD